MAEDTTQGAPAPSGESPEPSPSDTTSTEQSIADRRAAVRQAAEAAEKAVAASIFSEGLGER